MLIFIVPFALKMGLSGTRQAVKLNRKRRNQDLLDDVRRFRVLKLLNLNYNAFDRRKTRPAHFYPLRYV